MRILPRSSWLAGIGAVCIWWGCTFPTINLITTESTSSSSSTTTTSTTSTGGAGGGGEAGSGGSGTGASGGMGGGGMGGGGHAGHGGSGAGGSGGIGGSGGATTSGTGGSGGSGGCPDADDDTHLDKSCSGGSDCADHDDRAFPGQLQFFATPITGAVFPGTKPFDFNCDGNEGRDQTQMFTACSGSCTGSGFTASAVCGSDLNFIECYKPSLLEPCTMRTANPPVNLRCH